MKNNFKCGLCGRGIHRSLSQQKQSNSRLFFCTPWCKSVYAGYANKPVIPVASPLFGVVSKIAEHLAFVSLKKVHPNYIDQLGQYVVCVDPFRDNKTDYIRECFKAIKLTDIELLLPGKDWKSVGFQQRGNDFVVTD